MRSIASNIVSLCLLCTATVAAADPPPPPAELWHPHAHPARVERVIAGATRPWRTLNVMAEQGGKLEAVLVNEGAVLGEDGAAVLLARQEDIIPTLSHAQAQNAVALARAQQPLLEADVADAKRALELAERELDRVLRLREGGQSSEQEHDRLRSDRDRAAIAVQRAQAALATQAARVTAAELQVAETDEALRRLQLFLPGAQSAGEAPLRAHVATVLGLAAPLPARWVVVERMAEPGELVAAGSTVLRLAELSALLVALRLDEAEVAALRTALAAPDQPVQLRFAGGALAAVRLWRMDPEFDPVSRKRLVELVLPGTAAPEQTGGLAVELRVQMPDASGGLLVPAAYMGQRLERRFVRLADGSEHDVQVLRRTGNDWVVPASSLPAAAGLLPIAAAAPAVVSAPAGGASPVAPPAPSEAPAANAQPPAQAAR